VKIVVKEVKKLQPAELNEEFFNRFGVSTLEDLKSRVREFLEAAMERRARTDMVEQVYAYLQETINFDLPMDVVADQSLAILQRRYVNLLMQGMPKEEIEQQMDQLRASSDQQAKEQLKLFFIMSKVADQLGIEVSEEEINGHIAELAARQGRRPEKMREELLRDGSLAQFAIEVREQKCIAKILEKAKIVDAEPASGEKKPKSRKQQPQEAASEQQAPGESEEKTESKPKAASRKETAAKRKQKSVETSEKEEE
jgi:trigger factor